MPMYHYKCASHGVFEELQTYEQRAEPVACPQCASLSPRVIAIAPHMLGLDPATRKAMETNDRARHEPLFSTKEHRDHVIAHPKDHAPGCGCGAHDKPRKSKTVYLADGSKVFPADRPWMISH